MNFYNTKAWKRKRRWKLSVNPLCEHCGLIQRCEPARQVDHIIPISAGGDPFADDNLQSLCDSCHSRKTAREDGGFGNAKSNKPMKGCGADGLPLDRTHPWFTDSHNDTQPGGKTS